MARQTYCHIDFYATAIALAVGENWLALTAAAAAPRPSVGLSLLFPLLHEHLRVLESLLASLKGHHHRCYLSLQVITQNLFYSFHVFLSNDTYPIWVKKGQEEGKKVWPNLLEDYTSQPQGCLASAAWPPLWCVSHFGSRQRRTPIITPKKKVVLTTKKKDLLPRWCYPSRQHNTYPWLIADYWVQVRTPNKFGPTIRFSKALSRDLEDKVTVSPTSYPTDFPRHPHPK
ncbi:hypothetical protein ACLOJK_004796 [Asimina triloba]